MTGVGVLTEEVNRGEGEGPLGQEQGLEIGRVQVWFPQTLLPGFSNHQFFPQLVETTTLPGDQRAINVLNQNKQTPCQLPILVGVIIQAMGQTMAMAMASSSPASNCYLVRVCCDLVSHCRHDCVKKEESGPPGVLSPRNTLYRKLERCLFLAPQAFGLSPCLPTSHHALQGTHRMIYLKHDM